MGAILIDGDEDDREEDHEDQDGREGTHRGRDRAFIDLGLDQGR
jgi:hypothetical protein